MLECTTCLVTFHKLQPQALDSLSEGGERQFICPFCKEVIQASTEEEGGDQPTEEDKRFFDEGLALR